MMSEAVQAPGDKGNRLPANWAVATLGEVYVVVGGGTPSTENSEYWGDGTPWITSADINGVRDIQPRKWVTSKGVENSTTNIVPVRSLLVVTRVGLGKIAITNAPVCFSQDVQGLIQSPSLVLPEFALHLLSYELQILKFQGRGTTISGITKKQLTDLAFPLAPIAEQQRIVAKLEELFSELDKGVENLRTAQQQLKVYRQALLKHAFEGKLTAEWRAQNPDKLESADALLARIQQEREARYQQQLAEWQEAQQAWEASGKAGSKPTKPKEPKALPTLTVEELAELPELPDGWVYVRAEAISDFITKGTTPGKELLFDGTGEVPFIKVYNLTKTGALDFTISPTFVSRDTHNGFLARSKVYPGDVLMNIVGPPLGKVSIVPATYPEWNINQAIAIYRSELIQNKLLAAFLSSEINVRRMMSKSKATAGQFNLTLEICRDTIIPLCGAKEQEQLSRTLDEKLSNLDQLEKTIAESLQQTETLRQSILKKAFSGQLVPQHPDDEPASVLLERIRAERAAQDPTAKRGRKVAKPA